MSTGRNIDEIKRIILSLQLHDKENVSTPANWNLGDKVVLGAPLTLDEAEERKADSSGKINVIDWYLATKEI